MAEGMEFRLERLEHWDGSTAVDAVVGGAQGDRRSGSSKTG